MAGQTVSRRELKARVMRLAGWMRDNGIGRDRVAAYIPNIPEAVIAMLATAAVGGVFQAARLTSALAVPVTASARSNQSS